MERGFLSSCGRGRGVKEKEKHGMTAVNTHVTVVSGSNKDDDIGKNVSGNVFESGNVACLANRNVMEDIVLMGNDVSSDATTPATEQVVINTNMGRIITDWTVDDGDVNLSTCVVGIQFQRLLLL